MSCLLSQLQSLKAQPYSSQRDLHRLMDGGRWILRAAETEVAREWQWLHDALDEIARMRAEHGDAQAFRLMQAQAMAVGQRRLELSMRIAELEGQPRRDVSPAGGPNQPLAPRRAQFGRRSSAARG
jgi:hypothetical protein